MKIKKISYGRSVKRQISQFEPMETSLLIEAEVEGSNWKADFKELRAKVKKIIDAEDAVLAKLR